MRLSQASAEQAWWRSGGRCACGALATENHHIFSQQALRKWGREDLIDHPDNIVPLCKRCHAGHTSAMHRLPRSICRWAEKLADDDQKQLYLERFYGSL